MSPDNKVIILLVLAMISVLVLSNILVQIPINDWLTYGAFTYPIIFLVTDICNRKFGPEKSRKLVYLGFIMSVILSIYFANLRIAIASGLAFLSSQLLDIYIFNKYKNRVWWFPPLISSSFASLLDSLIFFGFAFSFLSLPWITWALGDFFVKIFMAIMLLLPYRLYLRKALML
ncbi:MAG: hypothetical protein CMM49_03925 [Rhodospirillaceae bacterium]|nr:hypothetical protein [Rhodospirillaceae bacterium]|tara:strand:- start:1854 stop:2375 length:522 start_codon:yes stop_codon:yes gene_type:complete